MTKDDLSCRRNTFTIDEKRKVVIIMDFDFENYRPPNTSVKIEFEDTNYDTTKTEFHTVIIGSGITTRNRKVVRESIQVDDADFPYLNFTWDVDGEFNFQHFPVTNFMLTSLKVHRVTENGIELVELEKDVDYEIKYAALARAYEGKIVTTVEVLEGGDIQEEDLIYDLEFELKIDDDDYQIRLVNSGDKLYLNDIFGNLELEEDGEEFFNDIGMASEIAFKLGVQQFFYLEVPRNYGERPTPEDYMKVIEKVFYERNAYRIVPLTDDADVTSSLARLVKAISNPIDKRESVAFISTDSRLIKDHTNLSELVQHIGDYSKSLNSSRVMNIYSGTSVDFAVGNRRYVLPTYFVNAALAFFDSTIGMSKPISTRTIDVFEQINAPKFRPRQWNELAKRGVCILYQDRNNGPLVIRHQLTTKRSSSARPEFVEYSITKNLDATVQLVRDRLEPYAGKENVTEGFFERVDAAFTTAKEDAKDREYVADIIELSPWELRKQDNGLNVREIKTNIVGRYRLVPLYPGNNIDVIFVI